MEFQTFLNPFGTALEQAGMALQNDSRAIANATNLYKLGMAREQYQAMVDDLTDSKRGADSAGGIKPPDPGKKGVSLESQGVLGGSSAEPNSTQLFQQVKTFDAMAKRFRYLNPSLSEKYASRAETTLQSAINLKDKEFQRQSKFIDTLGNVAATASQSPEAQGQALALLSHQLPPGMDMDSLLYNPPNKGGLGFIRGPNGQPVWNKGQWESLGQLSKNGQELLKAKRDELMEQARIKREELADKRIELAIKSGERADNRLRDSEKWHDDATEARKELHDEKNARLAVDKNQAILEKDPLYKNYDRYEQARGAVRFIEQKLAQPGGYQNVTAADVQQLRSHFNNIKEDFRTRAGGKYSEQDFAKLNGVLQSLDKWVSTIGRGTPAAAERPAKDAMAAINDEYTTRTTNLVKSELKIAQKVEKQGGDPENMRLKGDVGFLLQQGRATIKPDTEDPTKKWIFFRDDIDHPLPFYEGAF